MPNALPPLLLMPLLAACSPARSDTASASDDVLRRAVARLDYVAGEYEETVEGGRVVDEHEYEEAVERVGEARELARTEADPATTAAVDAVAAAVAAKAPAEDVERLVAQARGRLLARTRIAPPAGAPLSEARAAATYAARCASCHGVHGAGDGPAGVGMRPPPRDLTDPEVMATFTPLRAYSAVSDGIAETAMPAFSDLSDAERWELAFWVVGLRHAGEPAAAPPSGLPATPAKLADESDEALRAELAELDEAARDGALAWLRREAPWR